MPNTIYNGRKGIFPHQESKILFRRIHEDITTHNTRREDARNCALSFCAYTEREKADPKTKSRSQAGKQDKPRTTKAKP